MANLSLLPLTGLIPNNNASVGQEYTYDSDENTLVRDTQTQGLPTHNSAPTVSHTVVSTPVVPSPTLVGSSTGVQIDLIWDSSVAKAPAGFTTAIIDAATYIASQTAGGHEVINIQVGWGEIAGSTMSSSALGESQMNGYLVNYATATAPLTAMGYSFTANNEPVNAQFFITSAQAKADGYINATATGADGYIGFGSGFKWDVSANTGAAGTGTGSGQYDLQSVAQHEITEVMGRVEMQGAVMNNQHTYTTLDLFNFSSAGHLELSGNGGYFSVDDGATNLGWFNNASRYGGDIADWASTSVTAAGTDGLQHGFQDSFDAFGYSGINGEMSTSDVQVVGALGFGGDMFLV
jgi:hypothetical protein